MQIWYRLKCENSILFSSFILGSQSWLATTRCGRRLIATQTHVRVRICILFSSVFFECQSVAMIMCCRFSRESCQQKHTFKWMVSIRCQEILLIQFDTLKSKIQCILNAGPITYFYLFYKKKSERKCTNTFWKKKTFKTFQLIFETKLSRNRKYVHISICGCHFRAFLSQDVRPKAVIGMQWI